MTTANSPLLGVIDGQISHYTLLMLERVVQSYPYDASFSLRQLPCLKKRCFLQGVSGLPVGVLHLHLLRDCLTMVLSQILSHSARTVLT